MEVTLYGAAGLFVASHVTEGFRLALAHVPNPSRHTGDYYALNRDWDQLHNCGIVAHILDAQVTLLQSTLLQRVLI